MRQGITLLLCLLSFVVNSQPTITVSDMPSVGDTIRTRSSILGLGIDYEVTGNNHLWDFSSLSNASGGADTFISVNSTPLIYQLAFNLPFDPNRANLASPRENLSFIPNLPITDIIEFYKSSNTSFSMCGFGGTVSGIPLPLKFNALDVWYKFPLSVTSNPDSTQVSFSQGITGLGFLSIQRKRVNTVDGWGTMITPIGSYSTLRLKSVVQETDSIYIDSLSFGMAIPRNYTEYKWLANGKGIPVMEVSTENIIPTFTWQDSSAVSNPFTVTIGQDTSICAGSSLNLTVTPTGGTPPFFYLWDNGSISQTITVSPAISTTYNVYVTDAGFQLATASITVTVLPLPEVVLTKTPDVSYGCNDIPGWSVNLSVPQGFTMYNWSTGASGTNLNNIDVEVPGLGYVGLVDYWVDVTDQFGCTGRDSTSLFWVICEGIQSFQGKPELSVYPNPTHGFIHISGQGFEKGPIKCEVFNLLGVCLKDFTIFSDEGKRFHQVIDIKLFTLLPGQYFIKLSNNNTSRIQAVILE